MSLYNSVYNLNNISSVTTGVTLFTLTLTSCESPPSDYEFIYENKILYKNVKNKKSCSYLFNSTALLNGKFFTNELKVEITILNDKLIIIQLWADSQRVEILLF